MSTVIPSSDDLSDGWGGGAFYGGEGVFIALLFPHHGFSRQAILPLQEGGARQVPNQ